MEWYNPHNEFRWFGLQTLAIAESMERLAGVSEALEDHEVYLLSQRANRMECRMNTRELEIRELVNADEGLEQWKIKVRESFPMARTVLEDEILPMLGLHASLRQEEYDMEEVVDKVITNAPELIAVHIHRRGRQWQQRNCRLEHSELLINGAYLRSLAITGPDPVEVRQLRQELGLSGYENVSYLGVLKRITGMVPMVKVPDLPPSGEVPYP
ncbi:MAG TPA: hypothetical protein P5550_00710 [Bacteroidales bacterium]|nr:hypothetical protein [Bacteroidales bacterium]HRZ76967.1 hypothetical protein [Bacteroidales bacterium]